MKRKAPVQFDSHWKPIEGWPYQVSDTGLVASNRDECNSYVGKLLKPNRLKSRGHYIYYVLCRDGKTKTFYAHSLVAKTWIGPKPSAHHMVRHLDGDTQNNRYTNLAWGTAKENCADTTLHGNGPQGERSGRALLTNDKVAALRQEYQENLSKRRALGFTRASYGSVKAMAEREGLNLITLRCILSNRGYEEAEV